METITIFLSDIEADRFKLFQKYHKVFEELDKAKVFDMQFGKVTINIAYSEIQNITKEELVFKKL